MEKAKSIRPFTELLRELDEGAVLSDLSVKLNALVEAVHTEHKQGSLVLTINIRPAQNTNIAMLVSADIKVKKPEPEPRSSIMFPTEEFNLQRNNPKQMDMGLKVVTEEDSSELRKA